VVGAQHAKEASGSEDERDDKRNYVDGKEKWQRAR
jgi:hypothetical protein